MLSISKLFPLLAIMVSAFAWYDPTPLYGWKGAIVPLLSLVMFCMGLTLRTDDFRRVWKNPQPVALGLLVQFTVMPAAAYAIGYSLGLTDDLLIGLIIVGACAGGTASNVITFLARGDVALSVSITLASTLWGVIATPWLISAFAGQAIEVNTMGILMSIIRMVVIPLILGILITRYLPEFSRKIHQYLPDIASTVILFIIGIIVSLNADEISTLGGIVILAVILHNTTGLAAGYAAGKLTGQTEVTCRTMAIEIGMQNSGLGVALALKYFGPLAALPGAVFSIWHNISGSLIAGFWRWRTDQKIKAVTQQRAAAVTAVKIKDESR